MKAITRTAAWDSNLSDSYARWKKKELPEDSFQDFSQNFTRVISYCRRTLKDYESKKDYLGTIRLRLESWLQSSKDDIPLDEAVRILHNNFGVRDPTDYLNRQSRSRSPWPPARVDFKKRLVHVSVFEELLLRLVDQEIRNLEKQKKLGAVPTRVELDRSGTSNLKNRKRAKPQIQWKWHHRLLPYLFEKLGAEGAIPRTKEYADIWAALDGVFLKNDGKPISRKDLATWKSQYEVNRSGFPRGHILVDRLVDEIKGNP
jgi:hypothetical protein